MASENTQNATANATHDSLVTHSDHHNSLNSTAPEYPTFPPNNQQQPATKKPCPDYAQHPYPDYIQALPSPFQDPRTPRTNPTTNDNAIAARVNAVCAPVTASQRAEDERLKTMSWRERWRDRKARRAAEEKNKDPDLRPVERGSRAQFNVFGVNTQEKRERR